MPIPFLIPAAVAVVAGKKIHGKLKEWNEEYERDRNDSWKEFEKDFMTIEHLGRAQMFCLCDLPGYVEVLQKVKDFPEEGYVIEKGYIEKINGKVCRDKTVIEQTKTGDAGRFALMGFFDALQAGHRIGDNQGQTIFKEAKKYGGGEIGDMIRCLEERYSDKVLYMETYSWLDSELTVEYEKSAAFYDEIWRYADKLERKLQDILVRGEKDFNDLLGLPNHVDWREVGINMKVSYKRLYAISAVIMKMSHIALLDGAMLRDEHKAVLNKNKMKRLLYDDIEKLEGYIRCLDNSIVKDYGDGNEYDFRLMVDEDGNVSFYYYENGDWQGLPEADDLSQMCHGTEYHDNVKVISQYIKDTYNNYNAFQFICNEKDFELFLNKYDGERQKIIHRN